MNETITAIQTNSDHYTVACALRYRIFFEPLQLPDSILFDELEDYSDHYATLQDDRLIAYLRLTRHNARLYQISQLLVLPEHRQQGYASRLVKHVIETCLSRSDQELFLDARCDTTHFYQKLGFLSTGDEFPSSKTAIPHIRMALQR